MEAEYPEQVDLLWLAADHKEQVAAFLTAGEGPVPQETLRIRVDASRKGEMASLESLPVLGEPVVRVSVPRPEGYSSLAKRGLFVFDWRVRAGVAAYRLVATPAVVLHFKDLPTPLQNLMAGIFLRDCDFGEVDEVDVCQTVECVARHR